MSRLYVVKLSAPVLYGHITAMPMVSTTCRYHGVVKYLCYVEHVTKDSTDHVLILTITV